jgi:Fe-S cluster assembly protein SufD
MTAGHTSYAEDFQAVQATLPGAGVPWLQQLRTAAMESFLDSGFPTPRTEDWKYTDLRSLTRRHYTPASRPRPDGITVPADAWWQDELQHRLVFIDGHFMPELCPLGPLLSGVTITSLARVLEQQPELLEHRLGHNTDLEQPGFNAFNTAFMRDGAYIRLGAGAVLEQPVHLLFIATGTNASLRPVRNMIVAGAHSHATVIESYVALNDAAGLTSAVTEISLETGAHIEHYKLEEESASASHIAGIYVTQDRDSRFDSHNIAQGGQLVRNDLQVALNGPGAATALNGLTVTRGRQHVDNHTRVDHNAAQACSDEWYRGILDDRSRAVFNGRIVVHANAQQTVSHQHNHNLLLSGDAEVDAKPQLEINADDVQCTHGCTVGQLDEEALFYFRSRGVDATMARNLLVYAFAADVLERIRLQPVRRMLEQRLAGRFMETEVLDSLRDRLSG